uniref:Uncharacterized protein n=1 Tax=Xenopus tropicalis TaxID=8364 RepID=A0A6I8RFE3_XENTR
MCTTIMVISTLAMLLRRHFFNKGGVYGAIGGVIGRVIWSNRRSYMEGYMEQ